MPAPWTCLRIVVSDGSVKNFISVTWHSAGLRGPQARVNIYAGWWPSSTTTSTFDSIPKLVELEVHGCSSDCLIFFSEAVITCSVESTGVVGEKEEASKEDIEEDTKEHAKDKLVAVFSSILFVVVVVVGGGGGDDAKILR